MSLKEIHHSDTLADIFKTSNIVLSNSQIYAFKDYLESKLLNSQFGTGLCTAICNCTHVFGSAHRNSEVFRAMMSFVKARPSSFGYLDIPEEEWDKLTFNGKTEIRRARAHMIINGLEEMLDVEK